ncbi:MAG: AAA family ATPase, partial [Bdellovibrionales bacterium]|nr:AAA family ATPase [Bdellovibrionales bacterium]
MNSIFNYTVAVLFFLSSINSYAREKELLKVQQIKNELKQLYTGIDEEIEQVVTHVEEWLSLSPDQQKTPFVLNIWGPAGTGKTSLVKTILSKLNLNYIYLHAGREKREGSFILPIVASLEDSTTNNFLSYTSYKKNSRMVIIVDEVQELRDGNKEQEKDGSQSRFAA